MPEIVAPKWADYLVFALPPLSYNGGILPSTAVFDLEHQPTTFDVLPWLSIAKTMGAEKVHLVFDGKIQNWKYSTAEAFKRLGNITIPAIELMGLPWTIGAKKPGFTVGYHFGHLNEAFKTKGKIEKLPLIKSEDSGYVTVTLRDTIRNKSRDSNRDEWNKVISWLEEKGERVIVLDDGDAYGYTLTLKKRWSIYSNAKMNLGVNSGPMSMCAISDAPYMIFRCFIDNQEGREMENFRAKGGFPKGSQMLFKNDAQEMIYEEDTFENITRAYERVFEKQRIAA